LLTSLLSGSIQRWRSSGSGGVARSIFGRFVSGTLLRLYLMILAKIRDTIVI
jgi:hypothetical protein